MSLSHLAYIFSSLDVARVDFLEPRRRRVLCRRGRGRWLGRRESRLPGDLPPMGLSDCCIVITAEDIHTVEHVSQTTTTTTTTVVDRFAFLFFTSDLSVGSMWSARCAEDAGSFGTND